MRKSFMVASIFILSASKADKACWPLYAILNGKHGVYGESDFPIEYLYPGEVVYPDKVNRESLAFRHWRHHTPESIPDEAFNAHYMTRDQLEQDLARKAGFASAYVSDATINSQDSNLLKLPTNCKVMLESASAQNEKFKSVPISRYVKLPKAPEMIQKAIAQKGSASLFLQGLGIQPEMSKAKVFEAARNQVKEFSHKYFVDSSGKAYLFTATEQKKILEAAGIPSSEGISHPQLASLAFGDLKEEKQLIGVGYFQATETNGQLSIRTDVDLPMMNTSVLDFSKYFKEYLGL